jgi:HEAT repeat protein
MRPMTEQPTEIEIPDEPQTGAARAPGPDEGTEGESPYKNLFVPLVVVPALIVMVLVIVFSLFGALAGTEDSPRDNLDRLLTGGVNERQQAAFNLVRQILEYEHAKAEGREPEWGIDATFLPRLKNARDSLPAMKGPRDVATPFVLSSLLAQMGDPDGVRQLVEMTRLSETLDPEGDFRVNATFTLGAIGRDLAEPELLLAARTLIELLDDPDEGLVLAAAAGLQNLPSPGTVPALKGMLASRRVDHRLQAALSLTSLGDASGADVLLEMIRQEPYEAEREEAEREENPPLWAPQRVSESRRKALEALLELSLPPSTAVLELIAEDDPDPNIREAAREILAHTSDG